MSSTHQLSLLFFCLGTTFGSNIIADPGPYALIPTAKCTEDFDENQLVYVVPFVLVPARFQCFLPEQIKAIYNEHAEQDFNMPDEMNSLFKRIIKPRVDNNRAEMHYRNNDNKFESQTQNAIYSWRTDTTYFPCNYPETIDWTMCENDTTSFGTSIEEDMISGTVLSIIPIENHADKFHCFEKGEIEKINRNTRKNPYIPAQYLHQEDEVMKAILVNPQVISSVADDYDIEQCSQNTCAITRKPLINLTLISVVQRENTDVYDCFETTKLESFFNNPEFSHRYLSHYNGGNIISGGEHDVINPITGRPFPESTKDYTNWPIYRRRVALKYVDGHTNSQDQVGAIQDTIANLARQQDQIRQQHQQLRDVTLEDQYAYQYNWNHNDSPDHFVRHQDSSDNFMRHRDSSDHFVRHHDSSDNFMRHRIYGCTNSGANNYNPSATHDDGSCTYQDTPTWSDTETDYKFPIWGTILIVLVILGIAIGLIVHFCIKKRRQDEQQKFATMRSMIPPAPTSPEEMTIAVQPVNQLQGMPGESPQFQYSSEGNVQI